ncbi:hypothetical protein, partial [Sulfitobacter sp. HI0021]|uniref:hypothetical protein n=1 Tax=Sulfitobacter sp. HI0021 TaxID=1822224 RepID=UPI001F2FBC5D
DDLVCPGKANFKPTLRVGIAGKVCHQSGKVHRLWRWLILSCPGVVQKIVQKAVKPIDPLL